MSNSVQDPSGTDLIRNSSLYREFQAEREEILKHKWIESEKAGYDIGFERALTDWILKHRAKWRNSRPRNRTDALAGAVPLMQSREAAKDHENTNPPP
jgi:hypothetical protein